MEFLVNGEVKELNIYDENGVNWVADLIGNCKLWSEFEKDEETELYIMPTDEYEWWAQYIKDFEADEAEEKAIKQEYGISTEEMNQRMADALQYEDMEYHHYTKQRLFDDIRAEHSKVTELTNALIKAKEEAQKYINTEDGGTCNFDCPAIDYREMHMSKAKAVEAIKNAGLRCFEWKSWGGMMLVICGIGAGQGNRNTRMAEAAHESLKSSGISATMYYHMD